MELRTAQKLFLEKAEETRKNGNKRGLLIFATGLGKSLSALSDALKVAKKSEKILILAHNQDLLKQLSVDFKKLDKKRKIGFMYKVKKDLNANVIFGNVRTIKNYLSSFKKDEFAYIIVDESHHTSAKTYKTILEYFTPKFLLGMTATPTRNDEKDIFPLYDNNLILNVGEKEAMNKGWLRPYRMVAFWDRWCDYGDIEHYSTNEGLYKYDIKEVGKKYIVPERIKGIFDIIKNGKKGMSFKGIGTKKGVYFSVRCVVAKRYCNEFNKMGIKSVYIDGKTTPLQREKILKDFAEGKYQLLFNVGLIGEGFHIPKIDLVIIDRPTDSHILWNQQKGRQIFNIEGQEDSSEGLLIDFVGNSRGNFKKYTYNSERKNCKNKKEFIEMVENSIGVPCEFEGEVIESVLRDRGFYSEKDLKEIYFKIKKEIGHSPKNKEINPHLFKRYGGLNNFKIKIGEDIDIRYIKLNKEQLIKNYFDFKDKLGHKPSCTEIKKSKYPLSKYTHIFGTWNKFLKEIKEQTYYKYPTKEDLIKEYFRVKKFLCKKEEFCVSSIEIKNHGLYSDKQYPSIFGTWKKFLKEIKEDNKKINLKYEKEEIIKKYFRLKKKLKRRICCTDWEKEDKISYSTVLSRFGSYDKFLKEIKEEREKISKEDLINDYQELKKRLKRKIINKDFTKKNKMYSIGTYIARFGSFRKFMEHIGEGNWYKYHSKEELIKNYYNVKRKLKKIPSTIELDKHGIIVRNNYSTRFGTYKKFLNFIGEDMDKYGGNLQSKEKIEKKYLSVYNKLNRHPTYDEFINNKYLSAKATFKNHLKLKNTSMKEIYKYFDKIVNSNKNIKITTTYKPITIIPHKKLQRKQGNNPKPYPESLKQHEYKTTEEKIDIREKIISNIQDNDLVLLLESPELSAIKEIEKQNKKPRKIVIPNNKEFKKLAEALKNYETDLEIELINTSALQYLVDSEEKFDFLWLDYCGAFSYYMKDLDILFSKKFNNIKLVLTYNLFDPAKEDENYYFTRVIDYVLSKNEANKIRLMNDVSYRYKKNMYNIGFNIQKVN